MLSRTFLASVVAVTAATLATGSYPSSAAPLPAPQHSILQREALQPQAEAQTPGVMGGWFGNWHPPETVAARVSDGRGVLTDVAIFGWQFAGRSRPVCALTFHSGCVPQSSRRPYQSAELGRSWATLTDVNRWVSHIDLDASRAGELAAVLRNERRRGDLVSKLVEWAGDLEADGVDLDWESFAFHDGSNTWRKTRPAFVATVRQLAAELHDQGRKLSVTVPAGAHPFTPDGRPRVGSGYTVYDWGAIADSVDRLNLMTYDYSWSSPGPIGPTPWATQVVRSAVAQMGRDNADKIIVGVPLYGKSWPTAGIGKPVATLGRCPAKWRPRVTPEVFSVTPQSARALAADHDASVTYDPTSSEYHFRYGVRAAGTYPATVGSGRHKHTERRQRTCTLSRTVWFAAAKAVVRRAEMAREEGAGGVFLWNLASSDRSLFRGYARAMD